MSLGLSMWIAGSALAPVAVAWWEGIGVPIALAYLALAGWLLLGEVSHRVRGPAIVVSGLVFGAILAIDFAFSGSRVDVGWTTHLMLLAAAVIAVGWSTLSVIRRPRVGGLRWRFLLVMSVLAITPALTLSDLVQQEIRTTLTEQALQKVSGAAEEVAHRVEDYLAFSRDAVRTQAQLVTVREHLQLGPDAREEHRQQARIHGVLRSMLAQDALFIRSAGLYDLTGLDVADTDSSRVRTKAGETLWFAAAASSTLPQLSAVEDGVFRLAQSIRTEDGGVIGVLRVEYSAAVLQHFIARSNDRFGPGTYLILLDAAGQVLAHGADPDRRGQSVAGAHRDLRGLAELQERGADVEVDATEGPVRAAARVGTAGWWVISVHPASLMAEEINASGRLEAAIVLVVALLATICATLLARHMTSPIGEMTRSVRRIRERNFGTPLVPSGQDELGELSMAFEELRADLHRTVEGLERRTRDLRATNRVLENEMRERREAERQRLEMEAELRQHHKLEALGRLAGGVAHDLNNMLVPILGFAELGRNRLDEREAAEECFSEVIAAAGRAGSLVAQLLAFGRKQILEVGPVDLVDEIRQMKPMLRAAVPESIELDFRLGREAMARLDATQLQQVVLNLVVNARDAIDGSGRITVEVRTVPAGEGQVPSVLLTVGDDGHGMTAEDRDRIFDPFFSTKKRGEGTGLGLATVYGIVAQHGGKISLESAPGEGSHFMIEWPGCAEALPEEDEAPVEARGQGLEDALILVVDDQKAVRNLLALALERAGCRVLVAEDAEQAVEVWRSSEREPDLLVADVVLPGRSGPDLYREMARERPELPVLFISGYAAEHMEPETPAGSHRAFLSKPFGVARLVQVVESLLGRGGDTAFEGADSSERATGVAPPGAP